jgi:hypothetical protein
MSPATYARLRAWLALALTTAAFGLGILAILGLYDQSWEVIYNAFACTSLAAIVYCFVATYYQPSGPFRSVQSLPAICLTALLLVCPLGMLVYPACTSVLTATAQGQTHVRLKRIGFALHEYHDSHKQFPAAAIYDKDGKPLLSWRVAILPHLERADLHRRFKLDEPWDSPHNVALLDQMPDVFAPAPYDDDRTESHTTFVRVYVGPGAAFEGKVGLNVRDFKDGSSGTVLVILAQKAVPWTKPGDVFFTTTGTLERPRTTRSLTHQYMVLFGDASVRLLPVTCTDDELRAVITRSGGEPTPLCLDLSQ